MPCVNKIAATLEKEGIEYQILRIKSSVTNGKAGGYIYSKAKNDVISENGYHYGIAVDGKVFDNIHTNGVDYDTWKNDFILPLGGTIEPVDNTKK